eukprot:PITA_07670
MRAFGCVAYPHVPDQIRKKLDSKGEKCVFIGYCNESKAYKLYNPSTKKFIVSRDVQFIEDEAWNRSLAKTVNVKTIVSHEEEEEGTIANNPSLVAPPPPQQVQQTTPQAGIRTALRNQGSASPSTQQGSEIPSTMNEEIGAIEKSKTWELVHLPEGKDAIGVKWVYKTKRNVEGKIDRHKARLFVKGYKQQQGKDYYETFALVAMMETVRTVLSITAQHKWKIYQMDVKSAFMNGVLKEEVYVEQPPGYEVEGQEHKVCKLKKALYGLKQAPRAWYSRIDAYLIENGFDKCDVEPTLYIKENDDLWKDRKRLIGILYSSSESFMLTSYTDSDWAGSVDDRKSTSGYVFHMGSGAISWASKKQRVVSLSRADAEYVAATAVACQAVWLRRVLRDLCHEQEKGKTIHCDNSSAIALSKNSVFHKRTKHIDTKFHFIRELANNGEIVL